MLQHATPSFLALLLIAAGLSAHGGQYRGPPQGAGIPMPAKGAPLVPGPSAPARPAGPAAPRATPGATRPPSATATGTRADAPAPLTWQTWWEYNKEPFLRSRIEGAIVPVTGSDDFYLGARRSRQVIDVLAATDQDRADRIVPALARLLAAERNRDIQGAALIALGKVGLDGPGVDLEEVLSSRIRRDDQEVRETAVLALGIAGRRDAFPLLAGLVTDDKQARKLEDRGNVRLRTRAFAAYGLGLLARRVGDAQLSQQTHDLLWPLLQRPEIQDRDLRTAIVTALGVLRADSARSSDKRLAWQTVEELRDWFARDLGPGDEPVQAHAAIAIARLLGRGTTPVHQRCKQLFAATLNAKKRRGQTIRQSCAIALGMLSMPEEQHAAEGAFSRALWEHYEQGRDQAARQFSAIAVGRIGGLTNRTWLAKAYQRGSKSSERPWLALALGLLSEPSARDGKPDELLGSMLLEDLESASSDDQRAALAVAVGLVGCESAVPTLLRMLRDNESDENVAGYLCISLGLLRDPAAVSMLSAVLLRSTRRPFLLQQCAVALGCLGDKDANEKLVTMLSGGDSVAVLAAIATAIGRIGDRRAIDPLIALTQDRDLSKLSRAFVAAALGGVGDKDELPWNVPFSVDSNYNTGIDTLSNGATGVLDIL